MTLVGILHPFSLQDAVKRDLRGFLPYRFLTGTVADGE